MTTPDHVLDATGWHCPRPVIELARLARDLPGGGVITVLHTDPAAPGDIAAWCRMRGHDMLTGDEGRSTVRVRRTPAAGAPAAPSPTDAGTAPG